MTKILSSVPRIALLITMASLPALAEWRAASPAGSQTQSYNSVAPSYERSGSYGGWDGNLVFGGSGLNPSSSSPLDVPPNGWWASPYPSENPCQDGCNLNAGYEWGTVGALILETNPPQARVTLDGIFAGTTDKLGPFQLLIGEHTLHIEAAGYEPTDVIVSFDEPGTQSLNIALKRLTATAKPAPRR
jgi:hypothetical protein